MKCLDNIGITDIGKKLISKTSLKKNKNPVIPVLPNCQFIIFNSVK